MRDMTNQPMEFSDDMPGDSEDVRPEIDMEAAAAFGALVKKLKDEAVKARIDSGIEDEWTACEEAYAGIDDANRAEIKGAGWAKPATMDAPLTRNVGRKPIKSTVFVPITSRYVDASAAKVAKITLPVDGKTFGGAPTPIPDLIAGMGDFSQVTTQDGMPMWRAPEDGEEPTHQIGGNAARPMTKDDIAKQRMDKAEEAAKKAETRIYDWMVECDHHGEIRKVIDDAARIGVGVIKGPFANVSERMAVSRQSVGGVTAVAVQMVRNVTPADKRIDPWNCYPAPGCGEDIHAGNYFCERDFLSSKQLEDLKKHDGYLPDAIDKVLAEGPDKKYATEGTNPNRREADGKNQYTVWYFTGSVKRCDLESVGADLTGVPEDQNMVHAVATLVNDTIIKAHVSLLETGRLPYHVFCWTRRAGHWAGVGVAEKLRTPQRMVNAATRALNDNAGLAAGVQYVVDVGAIEPMDGNWMLLPNKGWRKRKDATIDDVRAAFQFYQFPNTTPNLLSIVQFALQLAEESASLPLIAQGRGGENPTLGQDELQANSANTLLETIAKRLDSLTEALVSQYYEMLLLDPEVPDEEKGDWTWDCSGSSALVQRSIQDQTLVSLLPMSKDPDYEISPAKLMSEVLKSKYIQPESIQYSDAEKEAMKNQPPATAPQVQVAQIRAEVDRERIARDTDRDTVYVQAQAERNSNDAHLRLQELQLRRELALLDYANKRELTLDAVKADLAKETMRLNTQRELSEVAREIRVPRITPPTEPAGRAENGMAFEQ